MNLLPKFNEFIVESTQNKAHQLIDALPKGSTFEDAKRIDSVFKRSTRSWSEAIETYERLQRSAKPEMVNLKDIRITQPNIQSGKVKRMIDEKDLPIINAVQFPDETVIFDGHHRLMAAWSIGLKKVKMNVVRAN